MSLPELDCRLSLVVVPEMQFITPEEIIYRPVHPEESLEVKLERSDLWRTSSLEKNPGL
jgi:hypothetical protein